MFTPADRARLRDALIASARDDPRVTAAALTGSAADGRKDRWSDVDLALRVGAEADLDGVVGDWTARMYDEHGAVHHLDVRRGTTLFRVFLLPSTLQVDIAFGRMRSSARSARASSSCSGAQATAPRTGRRTRRS